jgi:hypothetical protein
MDFCIVENSVLLICQSAERNAAVITRLTVYPVEIPGADFHFPNLFESFLGAFAKFRKATVSFVLAVRVFAWNNSALTGRIFMKFRIRVFFEYR